MRDGDVEACVGSGGWADLPWLPLVWVDSGCALVLALGGQWCSRFGEGKWSGVEWSVRGLLAVRGKCLCGCVLRGGGLRGEALSGDESCEGGAFCTIRGFSIATGKSVIRINKRFRRQAMQDSLFFCSVFGIVIYILICCNGFL